MTREVFKHAFFLTVSSCTILHGVILSKSSGVTLQLLMPFAWVLKLFLLYINISFWLSIQPCWQTRFGSVFLFWRLFTAATSACLLQVLGRWILKRAHHSICVGAMNNLSISVWFWLWRTDLKLTKDGNPTLTHRAGRKTWFFSGIGARCHLFKHGYEIPEQKPKAAARLRMWPFVQHSANNPGFPNKGLAQSTSPIVFSLCRDSQIFTENLSWIVSAGYIGVSAQKPETLMPWRIYQLWDSVVETFLQATKWNVWPTFTSVSLSLTTKLENFEIKNAKGSSPSANG